MVVTADLLRISEGDHIQLDLHIEDVRRIQFDIERERPATLVIVPQPASIEPQVIVVQPADYESVAYALAILGRQMASLKN